MYVYVCVCVYVVIISSYLISCLLCCALWPACLDLLDESQSNGKGGARRNKRGSVMSAEDAEDMAAIRELQKGGESVDDLLMGVDTS